MTALAEEPGFVRLVDISFADCATRLETWWLREGAAGGLRVGRSRLWWVGRADSHDGCDLTVRLHLSALRPKFPMRLRLLTWSSLRGMTHIELVPCRSVRAGRGYYAAGHALLDGLIVELASRIAMVQDLAEAI